MMESALIVSYTEAGNGYALHKKEDCGRDFKNI